jgi:hypothetical protein
MAENLLQRSSMMLEIWKPMMVPNLTSTRNIWSMNVKIWCVGKLCLMSSMLLPKRKMSLFGKASFYFFSSLVHYIDHIYFQTLSGFCFTDCLLAREVLSFDSHGSVASGFDEKPVPDGKEIWWLLEPKRAQAVDCWSGSMHHPNNPSQKHQTLMAFAHFTYEASQFQRLYVDLQSTHFTF